MAQHRYRSPEVPRGVTHEAIAWLGSDKQRSVIVAWIRERFVPLGADQILFDDRDSWDATEEVLDEFLGVVDEDVIEDAMWDAFAGAEFLRKGYPQFSLNRFDRQRLLELGDHAQTGGEVRLKTALELRERATLTHLVNDLLDRVSKIETVIGTPRHNGGPVDDSTPLGEFAHVSSEIRAISKQLSSGAPQPASIARSALSIEGIAARNGWDDPNSAAAEAYTQAFFETLGKDHAHILNGVLLAFICLIFKLLPQIVNWMEAAIH